MILHNLFQFCYIKSSSFLHLSLSLYQVNRVRETRNLGSAIIAAANVKLKVHTDQVGVLQRSRCEVSKINVFLGVVQYRYVNVNGIDIKHIFVELRPI